MSNIDRSKVERIGIDKLVLSNIKFESTKSFDVIEGEGFKKEKMLLEEGVSLEKTIKVSNNGELYEYTHLAFNPNTILYGHNIMNSRKKELGEAVKKIVSIFRDKDIQLDLSEATIKNIELNINIYENFEKYLEVLTLLFIGLNNLRKISNRRNCTSYKEMFKSSTLYAGWKTMGIRAYDKTLQIGDPHLLTDDLVRIEWWMQTSVYKYYTKRFHKDNTLKSLLEDDSILDEIFQELTKKKLFTPAFKHVDDVIIRNLELGYLEFKRSSILARKQKKVVPRNVYKYLEDNYWIFDYEHLIELVTQFDSRHKGREIERIKKNFSHLNNKEKLVHLAEKILHH